MMLPLDVRFEFHDAGPDEQGRRRFTVYWPADYHPGHPEGECVRRERGQVFFAVPPDCVTKTDDIL